MKWSQSRAGWEQGDRASPPYLSQFPQRALPRQRGSFRARCQIGQRAVLVLAVRTEQSKGALLRPAVITLESGGRTEIAPKIHAIRRFNLPATEAGIEAVQRIGQALAICFGGDPIFQQPANGPRPAARQFKPGAGVAGSRSKCGCGRNLTCI
jgi:hypothetical protein